MEQPLVVILATVLAVSICAGAAWYGWRHFDRYLPRAEREQFRVLDRAMRMEHDGPAAAERLLDDHFRKQAEIQADKRERLRARAPRDRVAAEELRAMLLDDLAVNAEARKHFQRAASADPKAHAALLAIDADDAKLRAEIASIEHLLGPSAS